LINELPVSINEVPFFRLIIPFVAGIACQYWLSVLPFSWWNYILIILLLGLVIISFFLASYWIFRWSFGLAINLFLFFSGVILSIKQPATDKLLVNSSNRAIVYLLDNPQLRAKSLRTQVEVRYLQSNNSWWSNQRKNARLF